MTVPRGARLALLVGLWLLLVVAGYHAWQRYQRFRAVDRVCGAVAAGDWRSAIEGSAELIGSDAQGLAAAECRAVALLSSGDREAGVALLEELLADDAVGDWLPAPALVMTAVAERRRAGRLPAAAALARRAAAAYPHDADVLYLELETRAEVEDEAALVDELVHRLPAMGGAAPLLRIRLAQRYAERGDFERAAELFGDGPPADALRDEWYRARAAAAAAAGDAAALAETCRRWRADGGGEVDVMAWHALAASIYRLADPGVPILPMLETALARERELTDRSMLPSLYQRLIASLIAARRPERAVAVLEAGEARLGDLGFDREEILRAAELGVAPEDPGDPADAAGTLRFTVAAPEPRMTLWLSPGPDEPVDGPFQPVDVPADGRLDVERAAGSAPARWVLRDAAGRARGSGAVWPARGATVEVAVAPREPREPRTYAPSQAPGDGRRRLVAAVLDCADWRLVGYLRARGELPVLGHLLGSGTRAVLDSRPALTAAAIEALVHPAREPSLSPVGVAHQLGLELQSNSFVATNPFAALAWLLPESASLFATVGAGPRVALNLLFAEGAIRGGRHGEMIGPGGQVRRFTRWKRRRDLEPEERSAFAAMTSDANHRGWIEEAAADFDALEAAVSDPEIDLVMLRVDPLDTATHADFGTVSRTGQDDAAQPLYVFYRYLDRRLGELFESLDADDVLIVMSDHGIATSMEHDPRALFVAAGGAVVAGRAPGRPPIRAVPRLLAELLGLETEWPGGLEVVFEEPR